LGLLIVAEKSKFYGGLPEGRGATEDKNGDDA
jgi:hypothetical protein